jgi:hypothetical protein
MANPPFYAEATRVVRNVGGIAGVAAADAADAVNTHAAEAVNAGAVVANDAASAARDFAANPFGGMFGNPAGPRGGAGGNLGIDIRDLGTGIRVPWGDVVPQPPPGRAIQPAGPVAARTPYTQLAQNAMALLRNANKELLGEAMQTVRAKQLAGGDIVNWLERRTKIGEVLGGPAANWSAETLSDFALAFQMSAARTPAMDAIVAIGVLNMPELENEIRAENTSGVTANDLVQNRRVVAQYPPPGTPLQPPYVVLVAVEYHDTRRADETVSAILGNLVTWQNYKLPRDAAAKLG